MKEALKKIRRYHSEGLIDDPHNLRGKSLYVYTGLRNSLFTPEQSLRVLQIYEPYIQDPQKVRTRVQDAALVLVSQTNSPNGLMFLDVICVKTNNCVY